MYAKNKKLIMGAIAGLLVWAGAQFMFVNVNWATAQARLTDAAQAEDGWDGYFKTEKKLLARPDAEKALKESNEKLERSYKELRKIEFGSAEALKPYTEAAAGSGDKANHFATQRKTLWVKAKSTLQINVAEDFGITDKLDNDPVALNLMRLALCDRLLLACKDAGVPTVKKIEHYAPKLIETPEMRDEASAEEKPDNKKDKDKEKEETKEAPDRLVQIPIKVTVSATERAFSQWLFELQRPTDDRRGYFCLRGFQVVVLDTSSGMVQGTVTVSALLNEKYVNSIGIKVKASGQRGGGEREINLERGY